MFLNFFLVKKLRNNNVAKTPTSKSQFTAKSVEDESYFAEEDQGDCVYVITYKKVYKNQSPGTPNASGTPRPSYAGYMPSSTSSPFLGGDDSSSRVNPYGTYRLLTPFFGAYADGAIDSPTSPADGLVYSRVKIRQLKFATLAKFIEKLINDETGELDSNLVQTFLATYRTFTDTQTVLNLLKER